MKKIIIFLFTIFLLPLSISFSKDNDLNTQLISAAKLNDLNEISSLINKGADVNCTWEVGIYFKKEYNPLIYSIDNSLSTLAIELINQNANVNKILNDKHIIFRAFYNSLYDVVKALIKKRVDINIKENNSTLLSKSLLIKNEAFSCWLIDNKADLNVKFIDAGYITNDEHTPLSYSICYKLHSISEKLIANGCNIDQKFKGRHIIFYAFDNELFDIVKSLINNGVNINIKDEANNNSTLLAKALINKKSDFAEWLINNKADLNVKFIDPGYITNDEHTPLTFSVKYGSYNLIDKLLSAGANVNDKISNNETALIIAVMKNDKKSFDKLIKYNPDLNNKDHDGYSSLLYAVTNNNYEIASQLLAKGSKVNDFVDPKFNFNNFKNIKYSTKLLAINSGKSKLSELKIPENNILTWSRRDSKNNALMLAIFNNNFNIVKLLIDFKADINMPNEGGLSPFIYSIIYNDMNAFNYLIDKANINPKNCPTTPLIAAITKNRADLVKKLIEKGADVNAVDGFQFSPLMYASLYPKNIEIVKLLVEKGADVKYKTTDGISALTFIELYDLTKTLKIIKLMKFYENLDINLNCDHTDIIKFLKEKGCNSDFSGLNSVKLLFDLDNYNIKIEKQLKTFIIPYLYYFLNENDPVSILNQFLDLYVNNQDLFNDFINNYKKLTNNSIEEIFNAADIKNFSVKLETILSKIEYVRNEIENNKELKNIIQFIDQLIVLNINNISAEDERKLGKLFLNKFKPLSDSLTQSKLDDLLSQIVNSPAFSLRWKEYKIYIIDDKNINAYSIPGGTIYITNELIKFIDNNYESLKFIIAHEIAHNELKHILNHYLEKSLLIKTITTYITSNQNVKDASMIFCDYFRNVIYSPVDETAADEFAINICKKINVKLADQIYLFDKILKNSNKINSNNKFEDNALKIIGELLRTHPNIDKRIDKIIELNKLDR